MNPAGHAQAVFGHAQDPEQQPSEQCAISGIIQRFWTSTELTSLPYGLNSYPAASHARKPPSKLNRLV